MKQLDCEQLTFYPAASRDRANHFLLPGSAEAQQMTVTSGRKCSELLKNSDPLTSLGKMLLESSVWHSRQRNLEWRAEKLYETQMKITTVEYFHNKKRCSSTQSSKTLKESGTPSKHLLFRLAVLTPRTNEKESQLWATPNTMDSFPSRGYEAATRQAEGARKGRTRPANLREQIDPIVCQACDDVAVQFFPTATAADTFSGNLKSTQQKPGSMHSVNLSDAVKMFPTPHANCANGVGEHGAGGQNLQTVVAMFPTATTGKLSEGTGGQRTLQKLSDVGVISEEEIRSMAAGNGGQLNPDWVEWLMGVPTGWTDIDADVEHPAPPENGQWWPPEPEGVPRVAQGVPNRVDRLKAIGNMVVPKQFFPFFATIAEIERAKDK